MARPFSEVRVLVLGAHTGAMQFFLRRFPAPGDYLVAERFREAADGAKGSNQAIAAARLGAQVTLLSAVGDDERGRSALDYLRGQGIDTSHVHVSRKLPTGFGAGFFLADGSVMGATYIGAAAEITAEYLEQERGVFFAGYDVFLASLELPVPVALQSIEMARAANIPLSILNPSPADDLPHAGLPLVDILTPNEPEARLLAGLAADGQEPASDVAHRLAEIYKVPTQIITLGAKGCYVHSCALSEHFPCPQVRAVDTSGAGDCFNGALAVSLAAGSSLSAAVRFALHAASLSVTRPDSWPAFPTRDEVVAFEEGCQATG